MSQIYIPTEEQFI